MAKLIVIIGGLLIGANFFITKILGRTVSGTNGRLSYGWISSDGIGRLANNLGDVLNDAVCSLIGPNFVNVPINTKNCPRGSFLPGMFYSVEDFCEFYNRACPAVQEFMTTKAIDLDINLTGISHFSIKMGKCCRSCESEAVRIHRTSLPNVYPYELAFNHLLGSGVRMGMTDSGLVGSLYKRLTGITSELNCALVGPNFMTIRIDSEDCPSGVFLANIFKSDAHFCDEYRRASPQNKKCMSDAFITLKAHIQGVFTGGDVIGKCCNFRYVKNQDDTDKDIYSQLDSPSADACDQR